MTTSKGYRKGSSAKRRDLYQEVTDRIVGALEQGTAPWVQPWRSLGVAEGNVLALFDTPRNAYALHTHVQRVADIFALSG